VANCRHVLSVLRSLIIINAVTGMATIGSKQRFALQSSDELSPVCLPVEKYTKAKELTQLHADTLEMASIVYSPTRSVEFNIYSLLATPRLQSMRDQSRESISRASGRYLISDGPGADVRPLHDVSDAV